MSVSASGIAADRPNRPLVIRCGYEGSSRKVNFPSAATCRLDSLRSRVEECFSLSAAPFSLSYTDDDGEEFIIKSELDLTEAISYFVSGDDDQAASVRSGADGSRAAPHGLHKIVLRLDVVMEYDGPSLSDTSSISGFSTSTGEEEESAWGSAYTRSIRSGRERTAGRGLRQNGVFEAQGGEIFVDGLGDLHIGDGNGITLADEPTLGSGRSAGRASHTSQTSTTRHALPTPPSSRGRTSDETARYPRSPPLTGPDSVPAPDLLTHSELGTRWLREQNQLVTSRRFGAPSVNGTRNREREDDSDSEDDGPADLELLRDARGKFYYSYGSEVSSIAPDLEADAANAGPSTLRPSRPASRPPIAFEPGISAGPSQTAVLDCSACGTTLEYLKYTCQVCGEGGAGGYQLCAGCIEVHGIGHARTAVAQASAAGRTELRHTFVEKIWSDTGWKDVEYSEDTECTICDSHLRHGRFKCVSCSKFDLCSSCYQVVEEIHPAHAFLSIGKGLTANVISRAVPQTVDRSTAVRHPGVFCHNCLRDIVGPRFHCAVCPSWDLCINCEGNAALSDGSGHNADHIMMKIPVPLGSQEVEAVSRRARDRWAQQDSSAVAAASASTSLRAVPPRAPSPTNETVYAGPQSRVANGVNGDRTTTGSRPSMNGQASTSDHQVRCGNCQQSIVGTRYQCANCPSDPTPYSLCSSCEVRSYRVHDPRHVFFKLTRPVHIPLQSSEPLLPILYKGKAGEVPASANIDPRDPTAYLKHVIHRETLCDIHSDQIRGAWLRCAHCPAGFDICQEAEEVAHHDPTHVFIVFKARVKMGAFRQIAHLEDAHPQPLLKAPVYLH